MLRKEKGFTLIELLIVIAIIGILAAIAIPMYKTQTIKAKMTEVTNAMSTVASAVAVYRQENGSWPAAAADKTAVASNFGVATGALSRLENISVSDAGLITATITGIDSSVDAKTLVLTPTANADGSISWAWSGTVPAAYIPKG